MGSPWSRFIHVVAAWVLLALAPHPAAGQASDAHPPVPGTRGQPACPLAAASEALERTGDLQEVWEIAQEELDELTALEQGERDVLLQALVKEAGAFSYIPQTVAQLRAALVPMTVAPAQLVAAHTCDGNCEDCAGPGASTPSRLLTQLLSRRQAVLARTVAILEATHEACEYAGGARAFGTPGCSACKGEPAPAGATRVQALQAERQRWSKALASETGCGTTCAQVTRITHAFRKLEAICPLSQNLAETTAELVVLLDVARRLDLYLVDVALAHEEVLAQLSGGELARLGQERPVLLEAWRLARELSLGVGRMTSTRSPVHSPEAEPR